MLSFPPIRKGFCQLPRENFFATPQFSRLTCFFSCSVVPAGSSDGTKSNEKSEFRITRVNAGWHEIPTYPADLVVPGSQKKKKKKKRKERKKTKAKGKSKELNLEISPAKIT